MSEIIDLSELKNNAPIIKITVAKVAIEIKVFFNLNCCKILFNCHEQGENFRTSFTKSIFHMYKQFENNQSALVENDFVEIDDSELKLVLNEILAQDSRVKLEYEKMDYTDIYEKFYCANKAVLQNATQGISKSLERMSKTLEAFNKPLITSISSAMNNIVIPAYNFPKFTPAFSEMIKIQQNNLPKFTSAFSEIAKMPQYDFSAFQSVLTNMPNIQFPELTSALANIPKPVFDMQAIISPLQGIMEKCQFVNESITKTLSTSLMQMAEATQKIMSTIDFSLLTYHQEWNEQRETLLKFGWFYSGELPEDIVNDIHERQGELSVEDVDKILVNYFRENKCDAIKRMVKQWNSLPYFSCRSRIFHEALVNHSRRYFNTSVTLLTVHTEGVITDFVRTSLNNPRFKVEKAIEDIKKELEESENISFYEFEVFHDVIVQIEEAFNENFKHSDPDATSNKSRHKIAHGHAYTPENEANSLKRFLYFNEIYSLFFKLSNPE